MEHVLATAGKHLDGDGRALLEEDLRSRCTEEVAVYHTFSRAVNEGRGGRGAGHRADRVHPPPAEGYRCVPPRGAADRQAAPERVITL